MKLPPIAHRSSCCVYDDSFIRKNPNGRTSVGENYTTRTSRSMKYSYTVAILYDVLFIYLIYKLNNFIVIKNN